MKNLSQLTKIRCLVVIVLLCAGYCGYLIYAGFTGQGGNPLKLEPIRLPFLLTRKIAHPKGSLPKPDSLHRQNYKY
jgi:hypothetical protein